MLQFIVTFLLVHWLHVAKCILINLLSGSVENIWLALSRHNIINIVQSILKSILNVTSTYHLRSCFMSPSSISNHIVHVSLHNCPCSADKSLTRRNWHLAEQKALALQRCQISLLEGYVTWLGRLKPLHCKTCLLNCMESMGELTHKWFVWRPWSIGGSSVQDHARIVPLVVHLETIGL